MSYCYDTMRRVYDEAIEPAVRGAGRERVALLFGFLIDAMHSANHELKDGINKNAKVTGAAAALEKAWKETRDA